MEKTEQEKIVYHPGIPARDLYSSLRTDRQGDSLEI
jgi:hypothetical protein